MNLKNTRQCNIPTLRSEIRKVPPEWALLEQLLIKTMNEGAVEFTKKYTRPDGTLIWRNQWPGMDGSDDGYETFNNFPLFYALGGSREVYEISRKEWDDITWQWNEYGQIYREFDAYYDWMHHGECNVYLYYFGLADPAVLKDRQRVVRFAGFYTGEDPEAQNYDPAKKLVRSPINGSRGPRFIMTEEDWCTHREVLDMYPPPFEDIPGVPVGNTCPWSDDEIYKVIIEKMNKRMARGDVPLNLNITGLITHAFMYTGDERYKRWVLDYLEVWIDRIKKNGGIIPDNVGLSGEIGEYMDGKWWGGYYGWRWPHGALTVVEPLINAGCNAALLTGDTSYLDAARSQIDLLWELGRKENGKWAVPHKHFDTGWTDYRPMDTKWPVYCWSFSMEDSDMERMMRCHNKEDWCVVPDSIDKGNRGENHQWFNYIQGNNNNYPEQILRANYRAVCSRIEEIRSDSEDPEHYDIHHWQDKNPVVCEAMVQLTMGALQNIYHGGLLNVPVRYYDGTGKRPGLPEQVSALVEKVSGGLIVLTLCNISTLQEKEVIIQAGAFGENEFLSAEMLDENGAILKSIAVNNKWLNIELASGSAIKLRLKTKRFANRPSYETPWVSGKDFPPLIKGRLGT